MCNVIMNFKNHLMKNLKCFIFLFGIFATFFFSCKKSDNSVNQINPLLLREWQLFSIQNTKNNQVLNYPENISNKESITFSDSLTMKFSGICNIGNAQYSINNNNIHIINLYTTLIFCNYWEIYLRNNLDSAYKYKVTDNQLDIYSKGAYNLVFIPNPSN